MLYLTPFCAVTWSWQLSEVGTVFPKDCIKDTQDASVTGTGEFEEKLKHCCGYHQALSWQVLPCGAFTQLHIVGTFNFSIAQHQWTESRHSDQEIQEACVHWYSKNFSVVLYSTLFTFYNFLHSDQMLHLKRSVMIFTSVQTCICPVKHNKNIIIF